ncbi:hypothetical protein ACQRXC_29465 (plasmid) [Niallia taxi]|uniref:hypothetical protein n=1 Tax=Niallia taxi TaxID=2499688 RepID=UPI003F607809
MYKVTFGKVDKKVSRSIKALKSKSGFALPEADRLLKEMQNVITKEMKITITIHDLDNEIDYTFEQKAISPDGREPKLMVILEDDIISSGHEDAQKIISDLEKQYQIELTAENENEDKENSRTARGNKKSLFSKFKKNKQEEVQEVKNDFADLVEDENENYSAVKNDFIEDDFADMNALSYESSSEETADLWADFKEETESEPTYNNDFSDFGSFNEGVEEEFSLNDFENQEYIPSDFAEQELEQPSEQVMIYDEFTEDESLPGTQKNDKVQLKHEQVIFPIYDTFIDLSSINNVVDRNKARFDNENLIKFLGLNKLNDSTIPELNTVILDYAKNALSDTKFELIRDYFLNQVETIKDKAQTELSQAYEQAMALNYREAAKEQHVEELQAIGLKSESELENFKLEQEQEYSNKLEKFELEQEKALEEFKKMQANEKAIFVNDMNTKREARIGIYKDNMQLELENSMNDFLDDKMFELKNASVNQLSEMKRRMIRIFEEELDGRVDDTWNTMQNALTELKEEIQSRIPNWTIELSRKRKLEAEEREEQRKQRELELERERIEVQRQQLKAIQNTTEATTNTGMNEELFLKMIDRYNDLLNKTLEVKQVNSMPAPQEYEQPQQPLPEVIKGTKKRKKSLLTSGIAGALLLGGGGLFVGQSLSNSDSNHVAQAKAPTSTNVEQETAAAVQKQESPTLKELLQEKNYDEAMSLYKDSDSLVTIEETLYQNKDLASLITFNKAFDGETVYGKIDEAILSKDDKKVTELYKKMSEVDKKNLSKERKSDIALSLYQRDENKLASKLLGS